MTKSEHTKEFRTFMDHVENDLFYAHYFLDSHPVSGRSVSPGPETNDHTLSLLESSLSFASRPNYSYMYPRYRWIGEIIISRVTGLFDYYVSQILRNVFRQKPEQLIGSKIDLGEILDATSTSEIIHRSQLIQIYADKKVHDMGYAGLYNLVGYLNKKLGLEIERDTLVFEKAREFVQVRHIIVHNAGHVDKSYLEHTNETNLKIGDLHPFTEGTYIRDGIVAIFTVAKDIDTQLITKFNLPDIEELDAQIIAKYDPSKRFSIGSPDDDDLRAKWLSQQDPES